MTTLTLPLTLPAVITVHVNAEDLLLGVRRDPWNCAVVRALRRTLALEGTRPDAISLGTSGNTHIHVGDDCGWYEHDAVLLVRAWDRGLPVEPCTVTLTRVTA